MAKMALFIQSLPNIKLDLYIVQTNLLFHDDWANNETNVLTKFHENWAEIEKYINETNILTNFYDDSAKIVTSRVFTRKTAPPPGSHLIQLTGSIFELNSHIKQTNVLTKFHENWAKTVTSRVFTCFHYIHIEKNAPPTGGHVFSLIWTIFEHAREKIVTSRVFTRKTALPPGSHFSELTGTIFELYSHIKETNVLTKFNEKWAKMKTAPPTGGHVFSPI
ncbi:hypothetical protein DPMN_183290 [Dreissena polymorpha]|uniref:Uncharacterized protein n=1 Tax=Dreissena polymorpha TaxID=45954 RepID=A0A9D4DJQ4_DREPO|nr:hypothetical protein DPMN_183290 [Dreissena polymorpha]